jgi:hypothetical protein
MLKTYYGTNHQLEHLLKIPTNDSKTYTSNLKVKRNNSMEKII